MKRYIAVLELEADEKSIEADVKYNYSSNGKDYSVIEFMWFEEESKEKNIKTYEDGLNEAWELARKIVCRETDGGKPIKWVEDTFGSVRTDIVMRNYSASEAIDAVESYEKLKVGDEVEHVDTYDKVIVTHASKDTQHIDIMWEDGSVGIRAPIEKFKKTGRHFTEIEELLKKMKENEE